MKTIQILQQMGFKITWRLLGMGLSGCDDIPVIINQDEIIEYLSDSLVEGDIQLDKKIVLMCEDDENAFKRLLEEYSLEENSDVDLQKRKWRVYLFKNTIERDNDYFQGLLDILELWVSTGYRTNCPLALPVIGDSKSIEKFFSKDSYDNCVEIIRSWIAMETAAIIELEKEQSGI